MKARWLLLGLAAALLVILAIEWFWGGGHPSLSGLLLVWSLYPTLTVYLSRELLGFDFPPPHLMLVGALEYIVVGVGLAALAAKSRGRVVAGAGAAKVALFIYIGAQLTAHLLLIVPSVNLRLLAAANPAVSNAAVTRIRDSGDASAVPALQQKLLEDFSRDGRLEAGTIHALTVLGGARGWRDLLDSGRLGVAGPAARAWRFIAERVREMANQPLPEPRGGVQSPDVRGEEIERFFDSLALALSERLKTVPDSEASLTLLSVMKDRPALCRKYFVFVPLGLRDARQQAAVDVVRSLAVMKVGPPADFNYDRQAMIVNDEMSRFDRDREAVAEEWIAWAKSNTPCR